MSLTVVSFATYCTSLAGWRSADYDAHDFVKALKGQSVNEYAWVKVRGQAKRFDNSNREEVMSWFGQMAGDYLRTHGPSPPFALVPIPSSFADLAFRGPGPSARMAAAIAAHLRSGVIVTDVLRFATPMLPSHLGGSRDAHTLFDRLRLIDSVGLPDAVLVDDVVVTGAHLRAAAAKLREEHDVFRVLLGICAASAEPRTIGETFCIHRRELLDLGDPEFGMPRRLRRDLEQPNP